MRYYLTLLLFILFPLLSQAQQGDPYFLSIKRDVPVLFGTIAVGVTSPIFHLSKPVLAYVPYSPNEVWKPERWVTDLHNEKAKLASDFLLYTSAATPVLMLADRKMRKDWRSYALYAETMGITLAITQFTKSITDRKRPYVYQQGNSREDIQDKDATQSFFSGHTSVAAASTFFMARMFADNHPNSRWKPVVWTAAAILPLSTGAMRVLAGKHFPTDVLIGYIVGAGIGYLVPYLHRIPLKRKVSTIRL